MLLSQINFGSSNLSPQTCQWTVLGARGAAGARAASAAPGRAPGPAPGAAARRSTGAPSARGRRTLSNSAVSRY